MPLGITEVRGILPRGGTILGSSRTNPFEVEGGVERIKAKLAATGVDALIAIGGEDTLGVATALHGDGVQVVGVPKTIDNDLDATDYTFGFDTAVQHRDGGDRPAAHHRRVPPPGAGRRGDGPARGLDRAARRHRRRRERDPDPGAAVRHRARSAQLVEAPLREPGTRRSSWSPRAPARRRDGRRWSASGSDAFGHVRLGGIGDRLAARDRGAHRQGGARGRARPRPARRHPDRLRPVAGHAFRPARDRRGPRRATGARWSRCAARTSSGCRSPRRPPS